MSTDTLLVEPSRVSPVRRAITTALTSREVAVFSVLVALILVATVKSSGFLLSSDGWRDLLLTPSILMLLAVGQTVVIITRNVDLSVGSILGLTAYLTGRLFVDNPGLPIVVVFLAGLAMGALLGLVNGVLVAFGKVPALVITLGTLYIYRGIFLTWAGSDRINASDMPRDFLQLGTKSVLGLPVLFLIARRRARHRRLLPLDLPWRSRALRDRVRPRRRRALRPQRAQAHPLRLRRVRRARRASPGCCTPPATAPSAPAPGPTSSCRRSAPP